MQPGGLFHIAKGVFDMPPIAVGCHNLGGRPFRVICEENRFAPMGIAPRHTRVVINPKGELRTLCGLSHCGRDPQSCRWGPALARVSSTRFRRLATDGRRRRGVGARLAHPFASREPRQTPGRPITIGYTPRHSGPIESLLTDDRSLWDTGMSA